jgi:hypothetical protein
MSTILYNYQISHDLIFLVAMGMLDTFPSLTNSSWTAYSFANFIVGVLLAMEISWKLIISTK